MGRAREGATACAPRPVTSPARGGRRDGSLLCVRPSGVPGLRGVRGGGIVGGAGVEAGEGVAGAAVGTQVDVAGGGGKGGVAEGPLHLMHGRAAVQGVAGVGVAQPVGGDGGLEAGPPRGGAHEAARGARIQRASAAGFVPMVDSTGATY